MPARRRLFGTPRRTRVARATRAVRRARRSLPRGSGRSGLARRFLGRRRGGMIRRGIRFASAGVKLFRAFGRKDEFQDVQKDISRSKALIPMGPRRAPLVATSLGKVCYQQHKTGFISNSEGLQGAGDMFVIYDSAEFVSQVAPEVALFTLNPLGGYAASSSATVYPGAPIGTSASILTKPNQRLLIKGCKLDLQLTNFGSLPTTVTLYISTPKLSVSTSPFTTWADYLTKENSVAGAAAYAASGTGGTFGGALFTDYGQAPERIKAWRATWRVLRKFEIELGGGSTHKFNLFFRYNRMVDHEFVDEMQSKSQNLMRNLTLGFSMISRTTPVHAEAGNTYSYGVTKVGYIASVHHYLEFPAAAPNVQFIAPEVQKDPVAGSGAGHTEKIMDVIDAVLDVAAAIA